MVSEFEKIFNELSRSNDRSVIWNNWLDYCININLMQIKSNYSSKDYYGNEESYFMMFNEWLQELNNKLNNIGEGYYDMIGELYEAAVQSKGKAKDFQQYFTPQSVTSVLADLTMSDGVEYNNDFANDCCCGSGRLLLAAHVKSESGLYCIGQDLDETSCKMAVLNFYSHGVRGSVLHMNTIEQTFIKGWRVNKWLLHGIPVPHIEEIYSIHDAFNFFGVENGDSVDGVIDSDTVSSVNGLKVVDGQARLI